MTQHMRQINALHFLLTFDHQLPAATPKKSRKKITESQTEAGKGEESPASFSSLLLLHSLSLVKLVNSPLPRQATASPSGTLTGKRRMDVRGCDLFGNQKWWRSYSKVQILGKSIGKTDRRTFARDEEVQYLLMGSFHFNINCSAEINVEIVSWDEDYYTGEAIIKFSHSHIV